MIEDFFTFFYDSAFANGERQDKDRLCVEIVGQNLDLCEAGELADNQ